MTQPDWYDENKLVSAIFAFEDGRSVYGGWVVDLGDGTCRFANSPMLGEDGPKWGDRVDLFYNPTDRSSRPWIGYRIYPDGELPGRNFGASRELTAEEKEEAEENRKRKEARDLRRMEEAHKRDMAFSGMTNDYLEVLQENISNVKKYKELEEKLIKSKAQVKLLKRRLNDAKGNSNVEQ